MSHASQTPGTWPQMTSCCCRPSCSLSRAKAIGNVVLEFSWRHLAVLQSGLQCERKQHGMQKVYSAKSNRVVACMARTAQTIEQLNASGPALKRVFGNRWCRKSIQQNIDRESWPAWREERRLLSNGALYGPALKCVFGNRRPAWLRGTSRVDQWIQGALAKQSAPSVLQVRTCAFDIV